MQVLPAKRDPRKKVCFGFFNLFEKNFARGARFG
jgi:hypothetical protein